MDDKDYEEVFHKDDRNLRAYGTSKKRNNLKEVQRRMAQMEKRNGNKQEEMSSEEDPPEMEENSRKKYGNGKPERIIKVQEYYTEDVEVDAKGKKGKKNK